MLIPGKYKNRILTVIVIVADLSTAEDWFTFPFVPVTWMMLSLFNSATWRELQLVKQRYKEVVIVVVHTVVSTGPDSCDYEASVILTYVLSFTHQILTVQPIIPKASVCDKLGMKLESQSTFLTYRTNRTMH